jgi:hypothetical protein
LGWLALVVGISADEDLLLQSTGTPWFYTLYVLGVLALLGVIAIAVHTVRTWKDAQRTVTVRVGETLLLLAALYLGWFILAFGLISFSVRY